jgi:hypothetical protein
MKKPYRYVREVMDGEHDYIESDQPDQPAFVITTSENIKNIRSAPMMQPHPHQRQVRIISIPHRKQSSKFNM